jgi:hypothetical protein
MGLFDRTASKLSGKTTLLLPADPGNALMDVARLYDPKVRSWHGRLVFRNGVLLFGPIPLTPELELQAGLPPGMMVAYYIEPAMQSHRNRRPHLSKQRDGDNLVQNLAARLGGTAIFAGETPDLAVLMAVYGEQDVPVDEVIELLRPYGGDFKVEDRDEYTYTLTGKEIYFLVAYWSPLLYREKDAPPALGPLRSRPLHQWELNTALSRKDIASELLSRVTEGSLALARRCGGVALDEYGFPINS